MTIFTTAEQRAIEYLSLVLTGMTNTTDRFVRDKASSDASLTPAQLDALERQLRSVLELSVTAGIRHLQDLPPDPMVRKSLQCLPLFLEKCLCHAKRHLQTAERSAL